ncbi:MAG: LysR family transcriptional regulator [Paracoccus denitrificans]|nr:MAG: LysR family transcriptional regulator [Paracoccus denitrificans]PZO84779.1 MAG: LysR family transcriptional regulator [Paracoccus denitrificans]
MAVKRRHLSSLGSFATFEVAAKHLSFTLAAKELNVTQGAVSQQIRLLERALDVQLFVRKHNALELTPEGITLVAAVTEGLDAISSAVGHLSGDDERRTITIAATDGISQFWLRPVVNRFRQSHPDIGFTIFSSDEDDNLRSYAEVDIAIICGNERGEVGEVTHFLFPEAAQPICTPAFRDMFGPFHHADSLNDVNLLHLHDRHWSADAIGWQALGWPEWFRAQGREWRRAPSTLITNKVSLLMAATLAGEGVMLGWHPMVYDLIENGQLVFAHDLPISAGRGNFLYCKKNSLKHPAIAAFVDFVQVEARRQADAVPLG